MFARTLSLLALLCLLPALPSVAAFPGGGVGDNFAITIETGDTGAGGAGAACGGGGPAGITCSGHLCTQSNKSGPLPVTAGDRDSGLGLGVDPDGPDEENPYRYRFGPYFGVFLAVEGNCG